MIILILDIWVSQRCLERAEQIPEMVVQLAQGFKLPKIELIRDANDEIQVKDGHHRLAAHYLYGKRILNKHDYILIEQDIYKQPRFGDIVKLIDTNKQVLCPNR